MTCRVELTLTVRRQVTASLVGKYAKATRAGKSAILDRLCAMNGWHRDHARKALRLAAAGPRAARKPRDPVVVYGPEVIEALRRVWAVLDGVTGKRLAPVMATLVESLRRHGELDIGDDLAAQLAAMSAATIDRRLAGDRAELTTGRGRALTKPGSLLKSQIPMRTWADWDEAVPGFLEVDLVGHDGGDNNDQFCFSLTATDIATGWTENRTVRNKAAKWVFGALVEIQAQMPFPVLGIDSDNGSEFINYHLLRWCEQQHITFTRSRPNNKNDGAHVEQKNWAVVRRTVGYWRYDTAREMALLNQIWTALSPFDEPVHSTAEAGLQDPGRRQGDQEVRHRQDPLPASPRPRRPSRCRRPEATRQEDPHGQPRPTPPSGHRPAEDTPGHGRAQEHHPPREAERGLPLPGKTE